MAIDNLSSFAKMLSDENNEDLKFKAQEIAAQYIGEAARRGVQMTLDDAYSLSAVRLHVLTGERVTDDWWSEAEGTLDNFQKAREDREIMEAINDENGDLKRKADAEAALQAELDALSPIERMKRARELGQRLPGPKTSGYADYAPLGRFLCPFPPLTALSNHEKRDPAITGSLRHFTWRFLSKSVVTIRGNSGLLFFCKIPEIVPFSCQHRPMADVFLDAIDRPAFLEAFDGKFVPQIMKSGIEPCFLSVFPEEVRRILVVAVFCGIPEHVGRGI